MAEDSTIILNANDQALGEIQIAPRVLNLSLGLPPAKLKASPGCTAPLPITLANC